eukprot:11197682-Lingulodinium_polyedra.AAC.1
MVAQDMMVVRSCHSTKEACVNASVRRTQQLKTVNAVAVEARCQHDRCDMQSRSSSLRPCVVR